MEEEDRSFALGGRQPGDPEDGLHPNSLEPQTPWFTQNTNGRIHGKPVYASHRQSVGNDMPACPIWA